MATAAAPSLASTYAFKPQKTSATFKDVGYGPLVVQRHELRNEIIQKANPERSVHISGCKGAGKTTLLHQIGQQLAEDGKTVFFFDNAAEFQLQSVNVWTRQMADGWTK